MCLLRLLGADWISTFAQVAQLSADLEELQQRLREAVEQNCSPGFSVSTWKILKFRQFIKNWQFTFKTNVSQRTKKLKHQTVRVTPGGLQHVRCSGSSRGPCGNGLFLFGCFYNHQQCVKPKNWSYDMDSSRPWYEKGSEWNMRSAQLWSAINKKEDDVYLTYIIWIDVAFCMVSSLKMIHPDINHNDNGSNHMNHRLSSQQLSAEEQLRQQGLRVQQADEESGELRKANEKLQVVSCEVGQPITGEQPICDGQMGTNRSWMLVFLSCWQVKSQGVKLCQTCWCLSIWHNAHDQLPLGASWAASKAAGRNSGMICQGFGMLSALDIPKKMHENPRNILESLHNVAHMIDPLLQAAKQTALRWTWLGSWKSPDTWRGENWENGFH